MACRLFLERVHIGFSLSRWIGPSLLIFTSDGHGCSLAVETQEMRTQCVKVDGDALTVDLADGQTIIVPLVWFPRLWHGTARERNHFEIFGEGRYIHWPDLDEDLTITGLLAGRHSGGNL